MQELIERLEKATGPDLDLDHAIARATRPFDGHGVLGYTSSIDAALTLVPEGWQAILYTERACAELYDATLKKRAGIKARAYAPTTAIAICIAALRARTALSGR
jgi:hypothetical protein